MDRIIYNKYSNERAQSFNIRTEIRADEQGRRCVRKYATGPESILHVRRMYDMHQRFREQYEGTGVQLCPCTMEGDAVCFPYMEGDSLKERMMEAIARNDLDGFYQMFDRYVTFVRNQGVVRQPRDRERFASIFGGEYPAGQEALPVHNPANLDLIFDNIIVSGDVWTVLDYEWTFDLDIPVVFILYRSVFYLIYQSAYQLKLEELKLYERAGVPVEYLDVFGRMEQAFQRYVVGDTQEVKQYCNRGIDVKKLMAQRIWEEREIVFQVYEDRGHGFREEESSRTVLELGENDSFSFSYTPDSRIKRLRIDPGDTAAVLYLEEPGILREAHTNGHWIDGNTVCFPNADPWFEMENPGHAIAVAGRAGKINQTAGSGVELLLQEVARQQAAIESWETQYRTLEKEHSQTRQELAMVLSSASWRLTAGLRKVSGVLRGRPRTDLAQPKIAVHLHLFYTDLLEEFLDYFSNIPDSFDLYISCVKGADRKAVSRRAQERLSQLRKVQVRICENRGRDIAPFYVEFGRELMQYQYVLHVHSKKSKHIQEGGADWRRYSLDSLLGTRELAAGILRKFMQEPDVGLIYPDWHPDIPMIGYTWMANGEGGRALLESMGIPCRDGLFFYPTGSFFWARVDALRPLFERGFTNKDFPPEEGQIDGTLAHVLERALAFVVQSRGYHSYIVDVAEHAMRRDRTMKPFREYLAKTKEDVLQELRQFESVSFGVFGTLIDFLPYRQGDIVELVRQKLGLDEVFVTLRREAERRAGARCGSAMTIDEIYAELTAISPFDAAAAAQLMQAELDCIGTCVAPREEMREVYRRLIAEGKQVAIVCDTYYHKATIESLLVKCGYIGYHKIWVSCDNGVSKRDEQLWNLVYAQYDPAHHIHVGSDAYADWYTLERRGTRSMYVMSARQAYELSAIYEEPSPDMDLQESMALGRRVKQELFPSPFGLSGREGMC